MINWTPANTKPDGFERPVLCWVVWPEISRHHEKAIIGWWRHGPECFSIEKIENANHLVTHWAEINKPN